MYSFQKPGKQAQRKWSSVMTPRDADSRCRLWVLRVLGCGGCLFLFLQIVAVVREFESTVIRLRVVFSFVLAE